jgi:hypothetical protein
VKNTAAMVWAKMMVRLTVVNVMVRKTAAGENRKNCICYIRRASFGKTEDGSSQSAFTWL